MCFELLSRMLENKPSFILEKLTSFSFSLNLELLIFYLFFSSLLNKTRRSLKDLLHVGGKLIIIIKEGELILNS